MPEPPGTRSYPSIHAQPAAELIEELRKANRELREARRAALNLMEDAILAKEALHIHEQRMRRQKEAFQAAINGAALHDSLGIIARLVHEETEGRARTSFYIVDAEGKHLHPIRGAGNMPEAFNAAVDGFIIGEDSVACGLAVPTGCPVIAPDVFADSSWQPWLPLAEKFELRGCWSFPVKTRDNKSIGTFGMYFNSVSEPTKDDLALAEIVTQTASVIIANYNNEQERTHAEAALRKSEEKYRSLFNSIDEGFHFIQLIYNDAGKAIDFLYLETNQSFERHTGLKNAAGKFGSEITPNTEDYWFKAYEAVARTGEPIRFENYNEFTGRWYSAYAFRASNENSALIAVLFNDITERKLREQQQQFLIKFSDALRAQPNADAIANRAIQMLAEYLQLDRCYIGVALLADNRGIFPYQVGNDRVPPMPQEGVCLSDFPEALRKTFNGTLVITDFQNIEDLTETEKQNFAALGFGALVVANVRKDEKNPDWSINAVSATPRHWTNLEIQLLEEVTERTWAAVERASAEDALKKSEERYRTLFETIDEGYALFDLIYDEAGNPVDLFYVETNPTFERMNGFSGTGKKLSEILGTLEPYWYEVYDRVVKTGEPMRVENSTELTGTWYSVYCSRIGGEGSNRIAVVFDDITERKQREQQQKYLLKLSDAVRSISEPLAIEETVTRLAMDHFATDRCYYGTIEGENAIIRNDARRRDLLSVSGKYPLSSFAIFKKAVDEGHPLVVNNARTTEILDEALREICIQLQVISFINIPVIKNGEAVGNFCLVQSAPRNWTEMEVRLAEETAERTWAAVERARAEEILRERGRELAKVQEIGNIGGVDIDVTNDLKGERSPEYLRLHGLPPDTKSETHKDWLQRLHPADRERAEKALFEALGSTASSYENEYRIIRPNDKQVRWIYAKLDIERDTEGKPVRLLGMHIDITQRKNAEEALRQSEERFRITLETAIDFAIINTNTKGLVEGWNSGAERIFGFTEEEMKGRTADIIFTEEDQANNVPAKEMATARKNGRAEDERWHKRKDGSRFYASGVMRPVYNPELAGYVKIARDMTEQKQAQEKLRIWEERYRIALQSASMAAWDWNVADDTINWNEQHYLMLGLEPSHIQKNLSFFMQFVHEYDQEHIREALQKAVNETGKFEAEFRIRRADNKEVRWMNGYGRVVAIKARKATRMVGVMFDITERKLLEQQKDDFIGIASHELKTPVTSIKAYTEILLELLDESGDALSKDLVVKLDKQVDRFMELIRLLLDITKLGEGQFLLNASTFDINELIAERIEELQHTTDRHHIVQYFDAAAMVTADRERIGEVLTNLISNAIKYSPRGGNIIINTLHTKEGIQVSIKDNGVGIPEDIKDKVFERFYRVRNATIDTFPGMGLGLYITAAIIQQHKGRIWVESEPEKGSIFYFTLPA